MNPDTTELAKALNAFQAELTTVGKQKENPFFRSRYADLASIMLATQPVLTKHGLAVIQLPDSTTDNMPALTTIVMHTSGQLVRATVPLVLAKADPQGLGSAITYMRRYAYAAALQIVIDEDDDGNYGTKPPAYRAQSAKTSPEAATLLQKEAIMEYLTKQGVSKNEMAGYLKSEYGVTMPLTRKTAGTILDAIIMEDNKA